jgi:hypothetical protein
VVITQVKKKRGSIFVSSASKKSEEASLKKV